MVDSELAKSSIVGESERERGGGRHVASCVSITKSHRKGSAVSNLKCITNTLH